MPSRPRAPRNKTYVEMDAAAVAKVGEVFLATGSYAEAAKAAGCTPAMAYWAIRRLAPAVRETVLVRLLLGKLLAGEFLL